MRQSKINANFQYNDKQWVVSIINTGSKLGGHAAIVVEGLENNQDMFPRPFIGQYDISANAAGNPDSIDEKNSLNNAQGYITKIKIFENENNTRDYEKEKFPAKSYHVSPIAAKKMISSIKADAKRTEDAMKNLDRANNPEILRDENGQEIQPLRFQRLGKNHFLVKLFGNPENGNNCAGWCLEKLALTGVVDGDEMPKPKTVAGQGCTIL